MNVPIPRRIAIGCLSQCGVEALKLGHLIRSGFGCAFWLPMFKERWRRVSQSHIRIDTQDS